MEFTPEEIAAEEARRRRDNGGYYPGRLRREPQPTDLDTSDGIPRCPRCGGEQFKARRTVGQRLGIGVIAAVTFPVSAVGGGMVAAKRIKQKVQCVTCGTFYARIS
jgi:hypothetical protein